MAAFFLARRLRRRFRRFFRFLFRFFFLELLRACAGPSQTCAPAVVGEAIPVSPVETKAASTKSTRRRLQDRVQRFIWETPVLVTAVGEVAPHRDVALALTALTSEPCGLLAATVGFAGALIFESPPTVRTG